MDPADKRAAPDSGPLAVQNFYFNGFQLTLSNADVNATLLLNNVPHAGLSMSYTTAKSLYLSLAEMIATLEKVTGREIMTAKQVGRGLDEIKPEDMGHENVH